MESWVLDHLEKMRAFEAVVRNGSLVRAARELGVSQPALSRLVSNLESVSGKRLLERSRLGCQPTPEGRDIVEFFGRLLPMARDLEQKVIAGGGVSGSLSIGTFESFAIAWWPEFLDELAEEFPKLRLGFRTASPGLHHERLLHGALDVVVEACPEEHERVSSIKVGSDRFGLFVPAKAVRRELPLAYVPQAKDDSDKRVAELLRERGVETRDVYELDSFSTAYEFAAAGLGCAVLPERLARKMAPRKHIKRSEQVRSPFGEHSICASFLVENRRDGRILALSRALKKFLAAEIK